MLEDKCSTHHFLEHPWHRGKKALIFSVPVCTPDLTPRLPTRQCPSLVSSLLPSQLREASPCQVSHGWPHQQCVVRTGVTVGGRMDSERTEEAKVSQDD